MVVLEVGHFFIRAAAPVRVARKSKSAGVL